MSERGSNRRALLDAAVRCVQETGYARTTARDLVAASGTNLGAIGYHFGSKEALLNEGLAECCRQWLRQLTDVAGNASSGGGVSDALETAYEALAANRALGVAYVEAWSQAQRSPELRSQLAEHYAEFREMTAAVVHAAVYGQSPTMSAADLDALATATIALTDGLLVQWLLDPSSLPSPPQLASAVRALAASQPT